MKYNCFYYNFEQIIFNGNKKSSFPLLFVLNYLICCEQFDPAFLKRFSGDSKRRADESSRYVELF